MEQPVETSTENRLRRRALQTFIVFMALSAVIAILTVLFGSFDWFEVRVLVTTSMVTACSICCMACALYAEKTGRREWALVGAGLNITGAAMIIFGAWLEPHGDGFWKTAAIACVYGVAITHYFLLAIAELKPGHRWLIAVALVSIMVNATAIAAAIIGESDGEMVVKAIAVLSILVALETLVIPVLARMNRRESDDPRDKLVLFRVREDVYRTEDDLYFRLQMIDAPPSEDAAPPAAD
ncbi:MAG: hypothetical protein ABIF71_07100 [Planctomycetota bacterium]